MERKVGSIWTSYYKLHMTFEKNDYDSSINYIQEYSDLTKTIIPSIWTINQGMEYFSVLFEKKDYKKRKESV